MIPPASRRVLSLPAIALALSFAVMACEKVPLLAPSGSTIVLTAAANVLPINATADIVATVLEAAGTPPHSGTMVSFTTTLGSIEPADARTDASGRVIVKFRASSNGTATITATSGGATTGTAGAIKIAVGTAGVGSIALSANPNPVSANSGLTTITANVVDVNGNALPLVSVRFSTTAGALGASQASTDQNGVAQTSLTTSAQATVTATVGAQAPTSAPPAGGDGGTTTPPASTGIATATVQVNVNPLPTVSISAPTGTLTAGSPIVFTITAQPGANSTAQIRNVRVNFGDGDIRDLGAVSGTGITVQHVYDEDDTYQVRVTVVDTFGVENSAATLIVVQPQPPLGVTINFVKAGTVVPVTVTFTATVTPSTTTVSSYFWNFGDQQSATSTSNQTVHPYSVAGVYTVTVTVTTTTGQTAVGQTGISIP